MKILNLNIQKRFLIKWILAVSLAWPTGIILTIILTYAVVNLFYPEDTNIIFGLCIGATSGFAQWLVFRKYFKISSWWILSSAIGFGIPIGVMIFMEEQGIVLPSPFNNEILSTIIFSCLGGFFAGVLQMPLIRSFSKLSTWWVAISLAGWGIAMLPTVLKDEFDLFYGGVILGAITGFAVLWLFKFQSEGSTSLLRNK